MSQNSNTVLMISPDFFGFNAETAETNSFQHSVQGDNIKEKALLEFQKMVKKLEANDINVISLSSQPNTPDAVFPNNWLAFFIKNGKRIMVTFPMLTESRKREVQVDNVIKSLAEKDLTVDEIIELGNDKDVLEGTGSMIIDHENKIAYASISSRTSENELEKFCKLLGFTNMGFKAFKTAAEPMYHTNMMMNIGKNFSVICVDAIGNDEDKEKVLNSLKQTKKTVIEISMKQVNEFCGNIIELQDKYGSPKILMSERAYRNFNQTQLTNLEKFGEILTVDVSTIENIGGGGARCMVCEIF